MPNNAGQFSAFNGKQYIYNVKQLKFAISPKQAVPPSSINLSKCSPQPVVAVVTADNNGLRRQLLPTDIVTTLPVNANWAEADEILAKMATGAANFTIETAEVQKV